MRDAGRNDDAEARLRQAVRFAPTNPAVNLNLGMLMAEVGKPAEAEVAFRTAFRSDPRSAQAAYNLGVLLAATKPEEALTWCRRAADLAPGEPKYAYTVAFYQTRQGMTNEAIQTLEKLIHQEPESYGAADRSVELMLEAAQWKTFFPMHGLADYWVYAFAQQRNGDLWKKNEVR